MFLTDLSDRQFEDDWSFFFWSLDTFHRREDWNVV